MTAVPLSTGRASQQQPNPRARYMSVHQVATHFGVSAMSIYRLIHGGELKAVQVGRSWRVPVAAVLDFETSHAVGSA